MSKTCCFSTSFCSRLGLDSGATWAPSWSQVGHFGLPKWHIFANMAQLEQKRAPKTPQECQNDAPRRPKSAKMTPKAIPRVPKRSQKVSQECLKTTQKALGSNIESNARKDMAKHSHTQQPNQNCRCERHLKSTYVLTE